MMKGSYKRNIKLTKTPLIQTRIQFKDMMIYILQYVQIPDSSDWTLDKSILHSVIHRLSNLNYLSTNNFHVKNNTNMTI